VVGFVVVVEFDVELLVRVNDTWNSNTLGLPQWLHGGISVSLGISLLLTHNGSAPSHREYLFKTQVLREEGVAARVKRVSTSGTAQVPARCGIGI